MLRHTRYECIGIPHVQHHRAEDVAVCNLQPCFCKRHATPLPQTEEFLDVTFPQRRICRISDADAIQTKAKLGNVPADHRSVAQ